MYREDTMLTAVHRVSVHVYVAHKCPCNLTTVPSIRISTYQWATPSDTQCHKHYGIVFFPALFKQNYFHIIHFIFCYIQGIDTICINKQKSILDICNLAVCGT